jgi:hypothetical protein
MARLRRRVLQPLGARLEGLQDGIQVDEGVPRLLQGDQEGSGAAEDVPRGRQVLWGLEDCSLWFVLRTVLQPEVGEVLGLLEALVAPPPLDGPPDPVAKRGEGAPGGASRTSSPGDPRVLRVDSCQLK